MRTARPLTVVPVWGGDPVLGGYVFMGICLFNSGMVLSWGGGGGGGWRWKGPPTPSPTPNHVTYPMMHLMSHLFPPRVEQTDACENITFARFATRAVTSEFQNDVFCTGIYAYITAVTLRFYK